MQNKNGLLLIGIVMGVVLAFLLFWYSQPITEPSTTVNQLDAINTQLQSRSTYGQLPITFSADKVGKDNPFQ